MREIKFRAWVKPLNKIGEVENLNITGNHDIIGFGNVYYKNLELMQYTGLKDKNGKEIYEGDIVELWDNASVAVEFNQGCFVFQAEGNPIALYRLIKDCEVIGNIYENPELLDPKEVSNK